MSKELKEYHSARRSTFVIGFGCLGGLVGLLLPAIGLTAFGTGSLISATLLGVPLGILLGALGALILHITIILLSDTAVQQPGQQYQQLVGQNCVRCQERICSIIEGLFCKTCGHAIHYNCISNDKEKENRCQLCGVASIKDSSVHRQ